MKKYSILALVAAFFIVLPAGLLAQRATPTDGFNNNGTRAAQFLKLAIGGRAAAMGESFAAVANDASALYWNPGGIGNLQNFEVQMIATSSAPVRKPYWPLKQPMTLT